MALMQDALAFNKHKTILIAACETLTCFYQNDFQKYVCPLQL